MNAEKIGILNEVWIRFSRIDFRSLYKTSRNPKKESIIKNMVIDSKRLFEIMNTIDPTKREKKIIFGFVMPRIISANLFIFVPFYIMVHLTIT